MLMNSILKCNSVELGNFFISDTKSNKLIKHLFSKPKLKLVQNYHFLCRKSPISKLSELKFPWNFLKFSIFPKGTFLNHYVVLPDHYSSCAVPLMQLIFELTNFLDLNLLNHRSK